MILLFFSCENPSVIELIQRHSDPNKVAVPSLPAHLLNLMEDCVVGKYCSTESTSLVDNDNQKEDLTALRFCLSLLDVERNLGYLLGLHAFHLKRGGPKKDSEEDWVKASQYVLCFKFLIGGLQVCQIDSIHNAFMIVGTIFKIFWVPLWSLVIIVYIGISQT